MQALQIRGHKLKDIN